MVVTLSERETKQRFLNGCHIEFFCEKNRGHTITCVPEQSLESNRDKNNRDIHFFCRVIQSREEALVQPYATLDDLIYRSLWSRLRNHHPFAPVAMKKGADGACRLGLPYLQL